VRPLRCPLGILLFLLLFSLAGCGASNGLDLGRVSGTITYKGEPIRNGTVLFMPDEAKGTHGPAAMGVIASDGTYVMTTEQTGDGALVGIHKVGILAIGKTPISTPEGAGETKEDDEVKAFFANKAAAASPKSKGARPKASTKGNYRDSHGRLFPILIPENLTRPTESGISVKVERGSNKFNIAIQENGTALVEK
jgi:hypothetical protein